MLAARGEYEDGLRSQLEALRVFRKEYGSDNHPKVGLAIEGIREAYLSSGRDEAKFAEWLNYMS